MTRFHLLHPAVLLGLFLPVAGLQAQTPAASPAPNNNSRLPLWTVKLPGGQVLVALNAIQFISSHEYVVDGGARVVEVNIDTNGPLVTRFYYVGPPDVKSPLGAGQSVIDQVLEKAQTITERTGTDAVWQKVVKNYPTTTHAHTVEFRLETEEELQQLFDSLSRAWRTGRPANFSLVK